MTAAIKLSMLFCTPFDALGSTMATYGGQNIGAGKVERVGKGLKSACIISFIYSAIAFVILALGASKLLLLFVNANETEIIKNATLFILINSGAYILLALVNVVRFMIQGIGFGKFAMYAGLLEMLARTLAGLFLVPIFGFVGACIASPLAWLFADCFLIPAYRRCIKICEKTQNKQLQV